MDEQAKDLLATLKKPVAVDAKLAAFNNLKSSIKHLRVPDSSQAPIFECIKLAIDSQNSSSLVSSGFSALGHFIKRLNLQDQASIISSQCNRLLPALLNRLGDSREKHRIEASAALPDLWPYAHADVERTLRDGALSGTNARAKEMAMQWVVKMNKTGGLQFKTFVPHVVSCLEDSDGSVRETAKGAIVELFRNAPEHAKTDLKKKMTARNVRKTIVAHIITQLGLRNSVEVDMGKSSASIPTVESLQHESAFGDSIISEQPPQPEVVPMDPIDVYGQRELEDAFREMHPHFEGRESEHNWLARDRSVTKVRRFLKGNAPTEFYAAFLAGVMGLRDGILKVANSLRTTMSTNGCQLIQELAKTLGAGIDPMVEIVLQSFIKMCAATKKIASQNGNVTVETLLANVSYHKNLMQHVWESFNDKNVQTRTFASGWLKVLLKKNSPHKSQFEHSGGVELTEKCLKKGLDDPNPIVREGTRSAYWVFAKGWPAKAEAFKSHLEDKKQLFIDKDPSNPNVALESSQSSIFSSSMRGGVRPSLKDTIAAQKRAAAAKNMPERPSSAQSSFSPVKSKSNTSLGTSRGAPSMSVRSTRPPSSMSGTARPGLTSAATATPSTTSGLMAAPVRRPRRPELSRPATADPYASRLPTKQSTPTMSPANSPAKDTTAKRPTVSRSTAKTPSRPPQKESPLRSKSRGDVHFSRRAPPTANLASSPSKDESMTMVMPFTVPPNDDEPNVALTHRGPLGGDVKSPASDSIPAGDEDAFTMIIPSMSYSAPRHAASPRASPQKTSSPRPSPMRQLADNSPRNSPLSRFKSPPLRTPERTSASLIEASRFDNDQVKVYEDPFVGEEQGARHTPSPEKPVLEELPLNERAPERRPSSSETLLSESSQLSNEQNVNQEDQRRGHHKTTSTGSVIANKNSDGEVMQDRAEVLRSRRLLASGIERIKGKNLDAHGFRRLQDLVRSNQDIWGEEGQKFGELLIALLEYLEAPNEVLKAPPVKALNLKAQVLATIRAMLVMHRKEASAYYSRAMCAVLLAKAHYENHSHITSDLEKTAVDIAKYGQTNDLINSVLDLVESSPPTEPAADNAPNKGRTIVMSLSVLAQLLQSAQTKNVPIASAQRLGRVVVRFLNDLDPDVRRADMEFCLELHERLGAEKDTFWRSVGGAKEQHLNLITYYIAQRERRRGMTA